MTLKEFLKSKHIDEIESDEVFCEEEYNAIKDYYDLYNVTDEDIAEIEARGYKEYFFR